MADWYWHPDGVDGNDGHDEDHPVQTWDRIIDAGDELETGDTVIMYPGETYTPSTTGVPVVPGYGGASYPGGISNGIGRDIRNGKILGRGAKITGPINALDQDASQLIAIAPDGWSVEDLQIIQTGDLSTAIEYFAVYMGPSGTVRNCIIEGSTCTAWGNGDATDHAGDPYSLAGPTLIEGCNLISHVAIIDAGGQTGNLTVRDNKCKILSGSGFAIGFVLWGGANRFQRNDIHNVGAAGNSIGTAGLIFVITSAQSTLDIDDCDILIRGRTAQTYVRWLGYGGHTIDRVSIRNSVIVAPEDHEADVTINTFETINSPFFTDPYGSNGPRSAWSNYALPRVKRRLAAVL